MTMVEIAKRNNVSERTIYRYKAYYDKMREEKDNERPFLRCYENGCMNFAVDFLYRKHETKKYLRSNFSTAKLKLQGAKQIHL